MEQKLITQWEEICHNLDHDPARLMDALRAVKRQSGAISDAAIDTLAQELQLHRVQVAGASTFYAFFSAQAKGRIVIRLCNDVVDMMSGVEDIAHTLEEELGIRMGETTPDGSFSLLYTPCIGLSDQAPAALVNDVPITYLTPEKARAMISELRDHGQPARLVQQRGDGNNASDLIASMVQNHILVEGPILLGAESGRTGLQNALAMSPTGVIERIKKARLRGCGGAGFPTAIKWEYTRASQADRRFILCNADEGEPGTFKDRILLTEYADLLWDGMTIAGYAIGASEGILYLRGEYAYLEPWLQHTLEQRRQAGWLGPQVGGRSDFAFDIRIQMGAGAYICGEETALISSCEGLRGDPKNRPPFPAQRGYLGYPSSVNNVETLCAAARIMEKGAEWFASHGTMRSAGSKLLSISGDCKRSGVYEVVFGTPLREVLRMAGAEDVQAVQVGGPSGQLIPSNEFDRVICYDDLSTGGSIMVFGQQRDLLEVVHQFLEFFAEESCGYCTPCRVGNVLLAKGVSRVIAGQAQASDLDALQELAETVKSTSRCGLGQTSPNAVLTTLKKFRYLYEKCLCSATSGLRPDFDITAATTQAAAIAGRSPVLALHHENGS